MRLTIRLLGTEVLHISTDRDELSPPSPGESTSFPVGFSGFTNDPRWQPGGEP